MRSAWGEGRREGRGRAKGEEEEDGLWGVHDGRDGEMGVGEIEVTTYT